MKIAIAVSSFGLAAATMCIAYEAKTAFEVVCWFVASLAWIFSGAVWIANRARFGP